LADPHATDLSSVSLHNGYVGSVCTHTTAYSSNTVPVLVDAVLDEPEIRSLPGSRALTGSARFRLAVCQRPLTKGGGTRSTQHGWASPDPVQHFARRASLPMDRFEPPGHPGLRVALQQSVIIASRYTAEGNLKAVRSWS
jgi:hypothetical protein